MNTIKLVRHSLMSLLLAVSLGETTRAAELNLERASDTTSILIRLLGVEPLVHDEWSIETSPDLVNWSDAQLAVLEDAWSYTPDPKHPSLFFRALHLGNNEAELGLYDTSTYRTLDLNFEASDWLARMTANYGSDTNVIGSLTVDGTQLEGVGVRFKGDTSYRNATTLKKSFNIEIDATDSDLRLFGYKTLNLNNAFTDPSFMREVLYNNFCRQYVPSPQANFVHLFVNGEDYGVYVNSQQENGDMIEEFFADNDGDRWRAGIAPNAAGGTGNQPTRPQPGGPRPGGGGGGGTSLLNFGGNLSWLGDEPGLYESGYILKTEGNPDPWTQLVNTIDTLNNSDPAQWPEELEAVLSVDRVLWMLALENIFLDADGYLAKAGDYLLYHDSNTGRIHPIQHDGNETFHRDATEITGGINADPFHGEDLTNDRPLTARLFAVDAYRQRYLAHLRTILTDTFHWDYFEPKIAAYRVLIESDVEADQIKETSYADFRNDTDPNDGELRQFIQDRRNFLLNHSAVNQASPLILSTDLRSEIVPIATQSTPIEIQLGEGPTIEQVSLYYTAQRDGQFSKIAAKQISDSTYRGEIPSFPAGTTVYFYSEAQAADAASTVAYFPAKAEGAPLSYQVGLEWAQSSDIVINEIMAKNESTLSDAAGEFDDWIELYNQSNTMIDLSGMFLTDDPTDPRQWMFPDGTAIGPGEHLIVWADKDDDQEGLHANFKLSSEGEVVWLTGSDAMGNLLLDTLEFGALEEDQSAGRTDEAGTIATMNPSPGEPNF